MTLDAYFLQGFYVGVRVDFGLRFAEIGLGLLIARLTWNRPKVFVYPPSCGQCRCCADALDRFRSNIEPIEDACSCIDYAEGEQCDCPFCVFCLAASEARS